MISRKLKVSRFSSFIRRVTTSPTNAGLPNITWNNWSKVTTLLTASNWRKTTFLTESTARLNTAIQMGIKVINMIILEKIVKNLSIRAIKKVVEINHICYLEYDAIITLHCKEGVVMTLRLADAKKVDMLHTEKITICLSIGNYIFIGILTRSWMFLFCTYEPFRR